MKIVPQVISQHPTRPSRFRYVALAICGDTGQHTASPEIAAIGTLSPYLPQSGEISVVGTPLAAMEKRFSGFC